MKDIKWYEDEAMRHARRAIFWVRVAIVAAIVAIFCQVMVILS